MESSLALIFLILSCLLPFVSASTSAFDNLSETYHSLFSEHVSAGGSYLETMIKAGSAITVGIIVGLGLFMTYSGKRFFKLFLGAAGFLAFGLLGSILTPELAKLDFIPPAHQHAAAFFFILSLGIIGALISIKLWKVGVFSACGFGGFVLARYILMLDNSHVVTGRMSGDLFTALVSLGALILGWFFAEKVLIFATSFGGSVATVFGADIFLKYGFVMALMNSAAHRFEFSTPLLVEIGAVLVLFVTGLVVQFLTSGKKVTVQSDLI